MILYCVKTCKNHPLNLGVVFDLFLISDSWYSRGMENILLSNLEFERDVIISSSIQIKDEQHYPPQVCQFRPEYFSGSY